MNQIRVYSSYDEANDQQITLLAAGIDAKVEYLGSRSNRLPQYALFADEERSADALALLLPVAEENYKSILRCQSCDGEKIKERHPSLFIGFLFLGIPFFVDFIISRSRGICFQCLDCGHEFRKKNGA